MMSKKNCIFVTMSSASMSKKDVDYAVLLWLSDKTAVLKSILWVVLITAKVVGIHINYKCRRYIANM